MQHEHIHRPSSHIVALAIIVGAVVFASLLSTYDGTNSKTPLLVESTSTQIGQREVINELDTDGDGIYDWEEILWGTDPNNSDTDGDGTPDSEAVAAKKNAITQQRSLTLQEAQSIFVDQAQKLSAGETTLSKAASQSLVAQYFFYKQAGIPLSDEAIEPLAEQLVAVAPTSFEPKIFVDTDIVRATEDGPAALKTYGNAVGAVLLNVVEPDVPHEIIVFFEFAQTQDYDTFISRLQTLDARYRFTLNGLATLPVPDSARSIHLRILNAIAQKHVAILHIASIQEDPLLAVSGIDTYSSKSSDVSAAFSALTKLLADEHVIFNEYETGYALSSQGGN